MFAIPAFFSKDLTQCLENDLRHKGLACYDGVIEENVLQSLWQEAHELFEADEFDAAEIKAFGSGKRVAQIRGDWVYWLPDSPQTQVQNQIAASFAILQQHLNRTCFLGIDHVNLHYACYPIGSFYKKHIDQPKGKSDRIVTVILYLNPNWQKGDGGELKVYPSQAGEEVQIIEPLWGRLVFFLSDVFAHEVLLCQKPRLSLTGWLRKRGLVGVF